VGHRSVRKAFQPSQIRAVRLCDQGVVFDDEHGYHDAAALGTVTVTTEP
jgi:hypothetical protein